MHGDAEVGDLLAAINVDVLARASSARAALALEHEFEPDVIVVVVEDDDDVDIARELAAALRSNAAPLVLCPLVAQSLDSVAAALDVVAPVIVPAVIRRRRRSRSTSVSGETLTRREREVLRLASRGLSNAAIARTLWVSDETVKSHLASIYRKLDVRGRRHAAEVAVERGYLDPQDLGDWAPAARQPAANAAAMDRL